MKRIFVALLVFAASVCAMAQSSEQEYLSRYEMLVNRLGPTGVGIETLIGKWEADHPEDVQMMCAKFSYYFTKAQTVEIKAKDQAKFLGDAPMLSLNDSTGKKVNYFQETFFDDEMYALAMQTIDKAIRTRPELLGLRFQKVTAQLSYEKESPDMATQSLKGLIDYNASAKPSWTYDDAPVDLDFFKSAIQEYCVVFFKTATPASYESFKSVSEKMLSYYPKDTQFLNNMGSYYLVYKKDNKNALKYYNKVLKIAPDDYSALKNAVLLARYEKNQKLEKKYLPGLIKVTDNEIEKASLQTRLDSLK